MGQIWFNRKMPNIFISYADNSFLCQATELSAQLNLPLMDLSSGVHKKAIRTDYSVHFSPAGLSFISHAKAHGAVSCDFTAGANRHRRNFGGGNGQMIAKAVGLSGKFYPKVLDVTAGLGADAFILASLGCQMQLIERNPIVHCLLRDGLHRAVLSGIEDSDLAEIINNINLLNEDSIDHLAAIEPHSRPDIVYVDPMFPVRKKSAQVKKEMQALHQIVGGDEDAGRVLDLALDKALYRVVVKRPAHSEYLGNLKPNYSLEGKSTRYDIFALKKIPK
jgi:16S rRNA (guanine1516-N2)-methyltransferase